MKIIVSLLLLLVSCSNHDSASFNSLYNSFIDWSSKYTYSSYEISSNNNLNKKFIGNRAYHDIKRFFIELNQINKIKLSPEKIIQHELLSNYLKLNIIKSERIRYNEWNLIGLLNDIYELLFGLHIQTTVFDDYKINEDRLYFIIDKINNIRKTVKYKYDEEYYLTYVEMSFDKLEELLDVMNLADSTFKSSLNEEMKDINDWYLSDYNRYPVITYDISTQDFQRFFSTYNEQYINLDSTLSLATKSLKVYEEKMVEYALPVYLSNNDEPIWTDFQDSLDVVNWVLDISRNTNYDCKDENTYMKELKLLFLDKLRTDIFYDISKIELESLLSNNLISNYYKILDLIIPGNLYQSYLLSNWDNHSQTLSSSNYLNGFKVLSMDYYTDEVFDKELDFSLCNISSRDFSYLMKIRFFIDRIQDSIETLALLHLYFENKSIKDVFNQYDNYGLFDESKKNQILLKIYSLESSGLSRFMSYINLKTKYLEENNDKLSIINLLINNPNISIEELGRVR